MTVSAKKATIQIGRLQQRDRKKITLQMFAKW